MEGVVSGSQLIILVIFILEKDWARKSILGALILSGFIKTLLRVNLFLIGEIQSMYCQKNVRLALFCRYATMVVVVIGKLMIKGCRFIPIVKAGWSSMILYEVD